jgi:putative DNA primase/helicase
VADLNANAIFGAERRDDPFVARVMRDVLSHGELPSLSKLHRTDTATAKEFARHSDGTLLFDHRVKTWRYFDSPVWRQDLTGDAVRSLQRFQEQRAVMAITDRESSSEEREQAVRHQLKQLGARQLSMILNLAASQSELARAGDEFDQDPWLFATSNGVVDLRTVTFRLGAPSDFLTLQGTARYQAGAQCPAWHEFLDQVFIGNSRLTAFVQRAVGYSLTGLTNEQTVFCLHGHGENGKGTFIETIADAVFGSYAGVLPFSSLLHTRDRRSVPDDIASIVGARMVVASEPTDRAVLDEGRIKAFSGEDSLKARHLYGKWFTFKPTLKLWLQYNHPPRVLDASHGMWRRMLVLPFERRFSGAMRDNDLKAKLAAQAAGILNWALEGCRVWQRGGLQPPPEVLNAAANWRAGEDFIAEFAQRCKPAPDCWVSTGEVFREFNRWCDAEAIPENDRPKRRPFSHQLAAIFPSVRRAEGNGFQLRING